SPKARRGPLVAGALALVGLAAVGLAVVGPAPDVAPVQVRVASGVEGELLVDGRSRGRIEPAVELVFELPPGPHRFAVMADEGLSLARAVDLDGPARVELELPSAPAGASAAEDVAEPPEPEAVAPEAVEPEAVEPEAVEPEEVEPAPAAPPAVTPPSTPVDLADVLARCRNDDACQVEALAGRARSPLERATLIQAYRDLGRSADMVREMRAFLAMYPDAPQAPSYRRQLE
ncbi:MAG: hypothetical protein AAGH15_08735, partial [Myxococcota bacterium]